MSVCTSTLKATPPERQRAISSPSTTLERKSPPAPPYSGGNSRPRKPSSPSRRQKARGIRPAVSHSATKGATSFSTKARTLFRSISCSGVKSALTGPVGLPDDLVGAREQRRRNREAERAGRLHVHHEVEPCGLLDGQLSRLRPLEDLVHVRRGATVDVGKV